MYSYQEIRSIDTGGITYLEPMQGTADWYWGSDYDSGDLYEAEEIHRMGKPVRPNKLVLVRYPEGEPVWPVEPKPGQYFGRPVFWDGKVVLLLVDFPAGEIRLLTFDGEKTEPLVTLPLSSVKDCYNLMLHTAPLTLTRQSADHEFQIVWPEQVSFSIHPHDSFYFRDGDRLYFSRWQEDPDYREESVVRDARTGAVLEIRPGTLMDLPDGQIWRLG